MVKGLKGKVIIITGASSGIGKALARQCAAQGASVVLAARRKERLDQIAAEIREDGGNAFAVTTDVSKESDVKHMVDATMKRFGRVDVLVNNAAYGLLARAEDTTREELHSLFDVNLFGLYNTYRAVMPVMKQQASGHIINISSIAGFVPMPSNSAYCATKAGVNLFTDALRMELAPYNIRISLICPGPVKTEFQETLVNKIDGPASISPPWMMQDPQSVAKIIRRCIKKPRARIITPFLMRGLWLAYAHFPRLVVRFLRSRR